MYNPAVIMLANLRALFGVFVDIMLLRRGPEHLPASPMLLTILVALNFVVYAIGTSTLMPPAGAHSADPWLVQGVGIALILVWFRIALLLAGKAERYVQTMIAVFGVNLLALPVLPLLAAMAPYMEQKSEAQQAPAVLSFMVVAIMFWLGAVMARILKGAFDWPWFVAIVFMISSYFGIATLLGLLFGEAPKVA